MAAIFVDVYGVLMIDFTPAGPTTDADNYQETLKKLKEAIREKRPGYLTTGVLV
jgi:Transposase.